MVYRFGDCCLDDAARLLTRNGEEQRLSKKAYSLLTLLLVARPKVVTKKQIIDAIWPDTFVSEANIAVLIGEVRAAVGDSARTAGVIRTHSGVGYSFVGEVSEAVRGGGIGTAGSWPLLVIGSRRIVLPDGVSTLGRDPSCNVAIPHPSVSRLHARIAIDGTSARIDDAGSKNGVFVNGQRVIDRMPLPSGATVRIGSVDAAFVWDEGSAGSTVSIPMADASAIASRRPPRTPPNRTGGS